MVCKKCNSSVGPGEYCGECGTLNEILSHEEERDKNTHSYRCNKNDLISVEYDKNKVLFANQISVFPLRLTALVNNVSNFVIGINMGGEMDDIDFIPISWNALVNDSRVIRGINLRPTTPGILGATLYLSFSHENQNFTYESDLSLKIYPDPSLVKKDIAINITAGHASDVNIKDLDFSDSTSDLDELIDENFNKREDWARLELFSSNRSITSHNDEVIPTEQPLNKILKIEIGGKNYTFVFKKELTLGKHRDCDFVSRLYENGRATSELNEKISRFHCTLYRKDNTFFLHDGALNQQGQYNPSMHGTYVDNVKIDSHNGHKLTARHRVTLGGIYAQSKGVFNIDVYTHNFVSTFTKEKSISSYLTISDGKNYTLLVDDTIPLNSICPTLPHVELLYEENHFILKGVQNRKILQSNTTCSMAGCDLRVLHIGEDKQ